MAYEVKNKLPNPLTLHADEAIGLTELKTLAVGGGVEVTGPNDEIRRLEQQGAILFSEVAASAAVPEPPPTSPPAPPETETPAANAESTDAAADANAETTTPPTEGE